jgi:tetratricopeptide (TPR) repeat protein
LVGREWRMRRIFGPIATAMALSLLSPPPAFAKDKSIDEKSALVNDEAMNAIQAGDPARALALVEPVLADYDKAYAGEKRRIYCGQTTEQTVMYMALAVSAPNKRDAVAINPGWCTTQYVRAFALVDLKRLDEAQAAFERLVEFAPQHARYLNELGYVLQQKRQWQASIAVYTRADAAAGLTPDRRDDERCVALRGIGYDLVEMGKLDDAERAYRKCLAITPNEPKSLGEIEYINQQRRKTS